MNKTKPDPDYPLKVLRVCRPSFRANEEPELLQGGNLNYVWRVRGRNDSYIVKWSPPYIASMPDLPLSQRRAVIEAGCLKELSEGNLADVSEGKVCVPRLYCFDTENRVQVVEDVGEQPDLNDLIREKRSQEIERGVRSIGSFIGRLHAKTAYVDDYRIRFDNREMQQTRKEVQYGSIESLLKQIGVEDAGVLGCKAVDLGNHLMEKGKCLIMGDLWPSSVLKGPKSYYLIDWELAHFGHPLQDVFHLCAHLWMQQKFHYGEDEKDWMISFLDAYKNALDQKEITLWNRKEIESGKIHFGCEILVRTIGSFKAGYLYEDLDEDQPKVKKANRCAIKCLNNGNIINWQKYLL